MVWYALWPKLTLIYTKKKTFVNITNISLAIVGKISIHKNFSPILVTIQWPLPHWRKCYTKTARFGKFSLFAIRHNLLHSLSLSLYIILIIIIYLINLDSDTEAFLIQSLHHCPQASVRSIHYHHWLTYTSTALTSIQESKAWCKGKVWKGLIPTSKHLDLHYSHLCLCFTCTGDNKAICVGAIPIAGITVSRWAWSIFILSPVSIILTTPVKLSLTSSTTPFLR